MALLVLPKRWLRESGQNQMCHLCGWLKLFLKKCGGKKNKKHRVGLSVGLLVVPLEYGLYVGHLSKWFVFVLMFKFWSVCRLVNGRPTIGYNVYVSAVAGIGGLSNGAKRNAKADQLRPVPRHNVNKENESNEDTEPRHCRNILLAPVPSSVSF